MVEVFKHPWPALAIYGRMPWLKLVLVLAFFLWEAPFIQAQEVLFAGDVTLTRNISPSQKNFFSAGAIDFISHADLFIWNLEFSGASANKKSKPFVFSCDSDIVSHMWFPNGVAMIANNHSFDGNAQGFKNLIKSLDKFKIRYCGLKNSTPAKNYIEVARDGCRFFVIGYTPMSHSQDKIYATSSWEDVLATVKNLKSRKQNGDFIIVNIHDGIEKTTQISSRQQSQADTLASMGVDVVSFTHSHTYIDPSKIRNTIVLWGMGNFIFGGNNIWRNNNDVRMMLVDLKNRSWRWIKGYTSNYVFSLYGKDGKR